MNDVFKQKTPKLYIISQNKDKKAKNFNPILEKIVQDKLKICNTPQMSSIKVIRKNNENLILEKRNSFFNSAKRNNSSFYKKEYTKKEINTFFQNENEYNYHQNNEINNLINVNINYKLKKYPSAKISNTTEIIHKKIRYHDLDAQSRKKSDKFYTPLLSKNNKNIENNNDEKSEDDPYITVYGVLFSKNNNLKYLKKKPNNLIMTNTNFSKSKLWKNKNYKKNIFPLSLPWLIKNKNKSNKNNIFISDKNDLSKSKGKKGDLNDNDLLSNKKDINNNIQEDIHIKNIKYKKMICYDMISIAGSDHGRNKINQDCYFIIPKLDGCEEVKIFGIFDGHGDNGDKISKEIKDYFEEYYNNLFNRNDNEETDKDKYDINKKKLFMNAINNYKNINQLNYNNIKSSKCLGDKIKNEIKNNYNLSKKFKNKNFKFNLLEEKKIITHTKSFIKSKIKYDKIKNIYNKLSTNNYSEIFSSYKKLEQILYSKYSSNNFCHLSGSTSLILFLINSKNCNKIISTNLGDSKIISISMDNKIKELNIIHTPNNPDEKNRIINNGGVINRIDWSNVGPLRIWYKNKRYPGLSITRSFGDFESDDLGVISEPDLKEYDIDEEKIKIIVFGTDGIWKFLTNDKIMDIVLPYYIQNDVNGATKKICETAIKLWKVKNPKGIADATVFVLFFK